MDSHTYFGGGMSCWYGGNFVGRSPGRVQPAFASKPLEAFSDGDRSKNARPGVAAIVRNNRAWLLASTACLCLALSPTPGWAQAVIEGGAVEFVPGSQSSPWNVGGTLTVGDSGDGTLVIGANGSPGVVTSTDGVLGKTAGSSGLVVISETGSKWGAGGHFVLVGGSGTGALTVQNGGALVTGVGDIGTQSQGDAP
jgi:T5SS/PEP-CTERM-associated repeat protein